MAAVIGFIDINAHCRNQPNRSKSVLYKPLLSHFLVIYISSKTKRFNYKGECGVRGHCMHKKDLAWATDK